MTYHCGIGASMAAAFGVRPREPHITCDGCGLVRSVYANQRSYAPAAWFLDGKRAPGWSGGRNAEGKRTDYCKQCKVATP